MKKKRATFWFRNIFLPVPRLSVLEKDEGWMWQKDWITGDWTHNAAINSIYIYTSLFHSFLCSCLLSFSVLILPFLPLLLFLSFLLCSLSLSFHFLPKLLFVLSPSNPFPFLRPRFLITPSLYSFGHHSSLPPPPHVVMLFCFYLSFYTFCPIFLFLLPSQSSLALFFPSFFNYCIFNTFFLTSPSFTSFSLLYCFTAIW